MERIPERRDKLWTLVGFPFANVVVLGLVTVACGALVGGLTYHHGWSGAINGAVLAGCSVFGFFFTGAYLVGPFANDEQEERMLWRILLPWAILAVVLTAYAAATQPWSF